GFGTGCGSGRDCDDADPSVGNECYRCAVPRPDCSCEEEGTRAPCGEVQSEVGGQKTCGLGETVCTNGTWSECIINNSVYLLPDGDPKLRSQALGAPDTCDSPCDPYCKQWPDTPGGIDG